MGLADTTPVTSSGRSGHLRGILVKIPAPPDSCRVQQEDRLRTNGAEDYPEAPATPPRRRICSHSTLERKKTLNSELTDQRLAIRVCESESSEAVRSVSHMHTCTHADVCV